MTVVNLALPDAEATARLGRWLGARLGVGDVLFLEGPIGAGKTHLARALIQSRLAELGLSEDVPSPTFTLVQVYEAGPMEIWHADLYRLSHPDEVAELGLEAAFGTALCLIEWPDRLGRHRPAHAITLRLDADGDARRVTIQGLPPGLAADLEGGLPDA
jgi:tRNA threonylcarbamoyladenosine biosynthesis protein TsaE